MTHSELFKEIETLVPTLGEWSTPLKCCEFASIILATRPMVSVEIGTFMGPGAFSMALAHRFIGFGKVHVIDPWSGSASAEGMDGVNAQWWADQQKHEYAYRAFMDTMARLNLGQWMHVQRKMSDDADVPETSGFTVVDGNHGPQAVKDVERWAPAVTRSGFVYLDDLNWEHGHVARAGDLLLKMGFTPSWPRDQGMFYQRSR